MEPVQDSSEILWELILQKKKKESQRGLVSVLLTFRDSVPTVAS